MLAFYIPITFKLRVLIQDSDGFLCMTTLFHAEQIFRLHRYNIMSDFTSVLVDIYADVFQESPCCPGFSIWQLGLSQPAQLALWDMWQWRTDEQSLFLYLDDEDKGIDTCHVSCMWLTAGAV